MYKIGTTFEDLNNISLTSNEIPYERPNYRNTNSKLEVWNSDIKEVFKEETVKENIINSDIVDLRKKNKE